ncbi:MAG: ADP-ribosylation factor-like protein [Candidatus Hodarchaeales archaeon]
MEVDGIIIFDSISGLPLYSEVDEKMDSALFSGFVSAIRSFSSHLSFGGLLSFTTEEKKVFLAAKTRIITALITGGNIDSKQGYSAAFKISQEFEKSYTVDNVTEDSGINKSKYKSFSTSLKDIIKTFPHTSKASSEEDKTISIFTLNKNDELEEINPNDDLFAIPVLIIVNTIIKKIYVLENGSEVSSYILLKNSHAATRINKQRYKGEFQISNISSPLDCGNIIDQAVALSKDCDIDAVVDEADKIILIGLAESGKTTIIKVIGEGYIPDRKAPYSATLDYKRSKISLLGENLTVFDLGGQKAFLDRFTGELASFIFARVKTLIFVIDIINVSQLSLSKYYLELALKNLRQFSPLAPIHVFLHKIDLLNKDKINEFSMNVKDYLQKNFDEPIEFYLTSVFNESIFEAFGTIFTSITKKTIPLEKIVSNFIRENPRVVKKAQLFTANSVPLLENADFPHVSLKRIKINLQSIIPDSSGSKGITSVFIEKKDEIIIMRFLNNGTVLFLVLSQEGLVESKESVCSIYNKIIVLTNRLNSPNP